jgi:DNA-binding transcriptional regulator YiaG
MPISNEGGESLDDLVQLYADLPDPAERRRLREASGLKQSELARVVGVSQPTLALWEGGRHRPSGRNLRSYVEALRKLRQAEAAKAPAA